jgi:hypothetical protein
MIVVHDVHKRLLTSASIKGARSTLELRLNARVWELLQAPAKTPWAALILFQARNQDCPSVRECPIPVLLFLLGPIPHQSRPRRSTASTFDVRVLCHSGIGMPFARPLLDLDSHCPSHPPNNCLFCLLAHLLTRH